MFPKARQRKGRVRPRAFVAIEPLENRALTSYLVIPRGNTFVPIHVSDVRSSEPLFSNGVGAKKAPRFYNFYTGPRRPDLNGIQASAYLSDNHLVLSGTVAGTIQTHPTDASQESLYTFGIDRGGASKKGPFPGREHVRFDSVVVTKVGRKGLSAYVQINDPKTNQPGTPIKSLPSSSVSIVGSVITVTVPLSLLPSSGHAMNQWNVNFFTRNPAQRPNFHSVASLTPEFTSFQIYARPAS